MDFAYPLIGDEVELEFVVNAFRARDVGDDAARSTTRRRTACASAEGALHPLDRRDELAA